MRETLLLQEFLNMFGVVKGSIEVEDDLRDDPELAAYLAPKGTAEFAHIVVEDLHDLFRL